MIRTFTGKNTFALQQTLKTAVGSMIQEVGDFGVERIDANESDTDSIIQAVQSLPFLVPKKLLVISNIQANGSLMNRIEELIGRTAESVDVILIDQNLDKRKTPFKTLQKLTKVQEFSELKTHELPGWIVEQAKTHEAHISHPDAAFLVERVGSNQQLLDKELEKLAVYDSQINRHSIELLTDQSVQSTIFSLLDAAFAGDSKKAIQIYREQRKARVEPQYVIAMLTWQLQVLAQAVYAEPRTEKTLTDAGVSPFTARKSLALAKQVSKSELKRMIMNLSELDAQIKTTISADDGLELYLLSL